MAETSLPFALIMQKGSVADEALDQPAPPPPPGGYSVDCSSGGGRPARAEALQRLLAKAPDDAALGQWDWASRSM